LFLLGAWQITPLSGSLLETLSPGTVALRQELLPAVLEQVALGETFQGSGQTAGRVISLYPGGTRATLVRLLAVARPSVVVRNEIASPKSLRRLAVVATVNGALLTLFGLVQLVGSPPQLLYWSVPTRGQIFGPFINRNHFAGYVNLCAGLGVGLL